MNTDWHELIQRYITGSATAEETTALQKALKTDAELRALYLDYLNLDVALGAAAEAATVTESGVGKVMTFPRPTAWLLRHYGRWVAATAACVALVVFTMLPKHRDSSRARQDIAATISSSQSAIARLSVEPPSTFPAWISPTASMLDQPRLPQ